MTNQSKIATKEICQKCARCCKEFNYIVDEDSARRFIMLDTDRIEVKEIKANNDNTYYSVKFKYPCRKLKVKDGNYYCSIYDYKALPRPHMCEEYPDNIPLALFDYEKDYCPALKEWIELIIPFEQRETETEVPICQGSNLIGMKEQEIVDMFHIKITHAHNPPISSETREQFIPDKLIREGMGLHVVGKQKDIDSLMNYDFKSRKSVLGEM